MPSTLRERRWTVFRPRCKFPVRGGKGFCNAMNITKKIFRRIHDYKTIALSCNLKTGDDRRWERLPHCKPLRRVSGSGAEHRVFLNQQQLGTDPFKVDQPRSVTQAHSRKNRDLPTIQAEIVLPYAIWQRVIEDVLRRCCSSLFGECVRLKTSPSWHPNGWAATLFPVAWPSPVAAIAAASA